MQLKLSKDRPDLTKIDSFLGILSAEGSFFEEGIFIPLHRFFLFHLD